jgi:SAM-dependent methyltransferase
MGLYARYLVPRLTHLAMARKLLLPYRQRVIGGAVGRVLEIGIGSGLNLPLYGDAVEEVIGIDISPELLAMADRAAMLQYQRLPLRRVVCSAPMARFASSNTGDLPIPRWRGGRTVSLRCGGAVRVVVI